MTIRKLTQEEKCLFAGFTFFPSMVFAYGDIPKECFTQLGWIFYSGFNELIENIMENNLPILQVATILNQNKKISIDEYCLAVDNFGFHDYQLNEYLIDKTYNDILKSKKKEILKSRLVSLLEKDFDLETINEKLSDIVQDDYVVDENFKSLLEINEHQDDDTKFSFGINKIDKHTKINSTDLIFIGARPFSGKSTIGVKIAMENTVYGKVLFYSLEMGASRIKWKARSYGTYYKPENLMVLEKTSTTLNAIYKSIKIHKPVCVIIDQLNKIDASTKGKTEYERFTFIARGLKVLAGRAKCPIVCLAQINRSAEDSQRPQLHNLKASGSIEEEGDVVILLHVPDVKECETMVYMDKNRTKYGNRTMSKLKFSTETDLYTNID